MAKKIQSEDPKLSAICDIVMGNIVLVASTIDRSQSRARAIELYSGVAAFCSRELFSIQGPDDPLYRRICSIVAEQFRIQIGDLCGKSRVCPRPQARAMTYLLLHEKGCTLKRCSEIIGISLTNLNYSISSLRREMDVNKELATVMIGTDVGPPDQGPP